MTQPNLKLPSQKPSLTKTIFRTALFVGTLDILAAIIMSFTRGSSPIDMFRYIASGVFGMEAFSGGPSFAFLGLIFHYLIAFIWTIVFFKLYPKISRSIKNNIHIGFAYGFLIWIVMNHIVLPLSNVSQGSFRLISTITGILILIAAIGLPLSFMASKYYNNIKRTP